MAKAKEMERTKEENHFNSNSFHKQTLHRQHLPVPHKPRKTRNSPCRRMLVTRTPVTHITGQNMNPIVDMTEITPKVIGCLAGHLSMLHILCLSTSDGSRVLISFLLLPFLKDRP